MQVILLAQGQTQGSTLIAHQQALNIDPLDNTCEADVVSPEVSIGGCRTQVSTTRGNASGINAITQGDQTILSKHKPTSHRYISDITY
jgi:hypothetical protein